VITLEIAVFLLYAGTVAGLFALLVPGYLAWLRWGQRPAPATSAPPLLVPPRVDVIVPVHDEAALIGAKLANLAALTYPPDRLRILVVDGASTDGTAELVEPLCPTDARFALLCLDVADKTRQMNAALARSRGEWVVITDADARLAPDTLERLVATGEADPAVAVVGTAVVPERAHVLERLHWRVANAIRRHESERGSASLVAGPCYAFRRALLERFPEDVVSDDVFVALAAAVAGRRVVVADVTVTEQRSPIGLRDLFRHKLRKTDAYLREIFRFLPHARAMPVTARTIFLWRAAHLTVLPVLVALGALGGVLALADPALGRAPQLALAASALALVGASSWGLARRANPVPLVAHGLLLAAVTLAALLAYPFSHQTASLPKIAGGSPAKRGRT
jgi:cellulose synthase/poly-beta-1,6-N-acetylglucosamine synthase-like glycosyltransferase